MKTKEVVVKVGSLEEAGERFVKSYNKIKDGKKAKKQEILAFEDIETLRKVLTNRRIGLIKLIRVKKPKSIYQLAKLCELPATEVAGVPGLVELE